MYSNDPLSESSVSGLQLLNRILGDRYDFLHEIAPGGMSNIYKAVQKSLNRKVALKVIHQNLVSDTELVNRFHREAKLCASLCHQNILTIYDHGTISDVHYMVMEFLEGQNLHQLIRKSGRLTPEDMFNYLLPVADALKYAHEQGIVHHDIKSSNIFITTSKRIVLIDFGIAFSLDSAISNPEESILGTPEYMSPEQADGREVDERSDLYSFGVVMYECLTGRVPFSGDNVADIIDKVMNELPDESYLRSISLPLRSMVLKLLSKRPGDRLPSAIKLHEALKLLIQGKEWQRAEPGTRYENTFSTSDYSSPEERINTGNKNSIGVIRVSSDFKITLANRQIGYVGDLDAFRGDLDNLSEYFRSYHLLDDVTEQNTGLYIIVLDKDLKNIIVKLQRDSNKIWICTRFPGMPELIRSVMSALRLPDENLHIISIYDAAINAFETITPRNLILCDKTDDEFRVVTASIGDGIMEAINIHAVKNMDPYELIKSVRGDFTDQPDVIPVFVNLFSGCPGVYQFQYDLTLSNLYMGMINLNNVSSGNLKDLLFLSISYTDIILKINRKEVLKLESQKTIPTITSESIYIKPSKIMEVELQSKIPGSNDMPDILYRKNLRMKFPEINKKNRSLKANFTINVDGMKILTFLINNKEYYRGYI